jgi:hypothetical protein
MVLRDNVARTANVRVVPRKKEEALGSLLWGLLQREKSRASWPRVCHATHGCRQYWLNTRPAKKLRPGELSIRGPRRNLA